MSLTSEETAELNDLYKKAIEQYFYAKNRIALSEAFSTDSEISIPAINELRHALDHLMKYLVVKGNLAEESSIPIDIPNDNYRYLKGHLDKCLGHFYRASYDAYDLIVISVKDKFNLLEQKFECEDITEVFPEYY